MLAKISKTTVLILVFSLLFSSLSGLVYSRSEEEIQSEIEQQAKNLEETRRELEEAEANLAESRDQLTSAGSELEKLKAEIAQIELELDVKKKDLANKLEEKLLKELQRDLKIEQQSEGINFSYMEWRSKSPFATTLLEQKYDSNKNDKYTAFILDQNKNQLVDIVKGVVDITNNIKEFESEIQRLAEQSADLELKKKEMEEVLNRYYSQYANAQGNVNGLQSTQENIQRTISNLTQEQKNAAQRENDILEGTNPSPSPSPIPDPEPQDPPVDNDQGNAVTKFSISGKGRDLYQGHGVGLSQWGAYGMAGNHGYTYQNILTFYYSSTQISGGYENRSINVAGYGTMNIERYAAGLGEVPDKACGNATQAASNPSKYVIDNPTTVWDCWPEHAIKAQVVAARTYAINYSGQICTTAACQVYNGGEGKKWAADETRGQIVTYGGNPINAVYSADNNQGSGSANNDTIWQNIDGNGYPSPYLRAKNDNSVASYTQWTHWSYQTRQYTMQNLDEMLAYGATNAEVYSSSSRSYFSNLRNTLGNITSIELEKDPSGRVKKVWLRGSSGQTLPIGGWWFKNLWINWVYDKGTNDYVYSQTFDIIYH